MIRYRKLCKKAGSFQDWRYSVCYISDPSTYKKGTPYFVSEFGGTWWVPDKEGWGYGNAPNTEEEFLKRFEGLVRYL